LTTTEVAALTLVCGAQGDVVTLLAYTGMRFGELTGLNVEDIDLKARRIRVRRSITQVGGKLVEGNPKSSAGRRSIDADLYDDELDDVASALDALDDRRLDER